MTAEFGAISTVAELTPSSSVATGIWTGGPSLLAAIRVLSCSGDGTAGDPIATHAASGFAWD